MSFHFISYLLKQLLLAAWICQPRYRASVKGALAGPKQFLANDSPLQMMKNAF